MKSETVFQIVLTIIILILYLEIRPFMKSNTENNYFEDHQISKRRDQNENMKAYPDAYQNAATKDDAAPKDSKDDPSKMSTSSPSLPPFKSTDEDYKKWSNCFLNVTAPLLSNVTGMWWHLPRSIRTCETILDTRIQIKDYKNHGEIKRHVLPLKKEPSVLLTFGVGRDITAEETLIPDLHNESKFYGADPVYEQNAELFRKIGTFFNFGLDAETGLYEESVLDGHKYKNKVVPVLDLSYFITQVLKRQYLDAMWMDAEGAEYKMLKYFYEEGKLYQKNIVVCQINIEIHEPLNDDMKQQTHNFLVRLAKEGRYAVFRPAKLYQLLRIYLFNFGEKICMDKYVSPPKTKT